MAGRNKIVNGSVQGKDYFFQDDSTPLQRGKRFLTDHRPDETRYRSFFESFTNKKEVTDKAYEDDNTKPIEEKQGLTTLATDAQAKSFANKSENVARSVQPSQLPEVVGEGDINVRVDETESRRNKYIISANIPEPCPCVTGIGQLIEDDIPLDADIIVFYDGTSFVGSASLGVAQTRVRSWYETYRTSNTNVTGKLIEIVIGSRPDPNTGELYSYNIIDKTDYVYPNTADERFLLFPKEYINDNIETALRITESDGTITSNVKLQTEHATTPINRKCVCLVFIDETFSQYHTGTVGTSVGDSGGVATTTYKSDFAISTQSTSNQFDFFKGIVYPAFSSNGGNLTTTVAGFHAFLSKAITDGIWNNNKGLTAIQSIAGWASNTMDFMLTSNPFTIDGVDGLTNFGWYSSEYDFTTSGVMNEITQEAFDYQLNTAIESSTGDSKIVTITPWLEYNNDSSTRVYGEPYTLKIFV